MNKLLESEIDKLSIKDMDDYIGVSLKAIAKCRFFYTSSYNILDDINKIGMVNQEVDVREAALLATINYITDYLTNQLSIANA
jgi:hypothetical protein